MTAKHNSRNFNLQPDAAAPQIIEPFDYNILDADLAEMAQEVANNYRDRSRSYFIDTGRDLLLIKKKIDHGLFLTWVRAELGLEARTAQNFMRAAEHFGDKSEIVSRLPPSVIYMLAAPSTPESLRESVVSRLEAGGVLEPKAIASEIRDARTAKRNAADTAKKTEECPSLSDEQQLDEGTIRLNNNQICAIQDGESDSNQSEPPRLDKDEVERGAKFLVGRIGADDLAAFFTRYGRSPLQVLSRAAALADAQRAMDTPAIEVSVDLIEDINAVSSPEVSSQKNWRMIAYESGLNNGLPLPPIIVAKMRKNRYILMEGVYAFLTLRDRLKRSTVTVHVVPTADTISSIEDAANCSSAQHGCPSV